MGKEFLGWGGDGDRNNGDGWGWGPILVPMQLSNQNCTRVVEK